jgi:hypothetical protein
MPGRAAAQSKVDDVVFWGVFALLIAFALLLPALLASLGHRVE